MSRPDKREFFHRRGCQDFATMLLAGFGHHLIIDNSCAAVALTILAVICGDVSIRSEMSGLVQHDSVELPFAAARK